MSQVSTVRQFLKERLFNEVEVIVRAKEEWQQLRDLLGRTAASGESNSALFIGPRGVGKTAIVSSVLTSLEGDKSFSENSIIVQLNGTIHTDDRIALKSVTAQMSLENAVDGKVFLSFAENLAFLLACLKSGDKKSSKSVIFILDEFDMFCSHHNQTLLYNLFDVAQSAQAPICVLGVTCRLDVIELLEKRVKSRFSHRQIFLFAPTDCSEEYLKILGNILRIQTVCSITKSSNMYRFDTNFVKQWTSSVDKLVKDKSVRHSIELMCDYDCTAAVFQQFMFELICQLKERHHEFITADDIVNASKQYECDNKILLLLGLSVLELCLVISIKHHNEIYDDEPFNFQIIFSRLKKLNSYWMTSLDKAVALKAFEHLKILEFVIPVGGISSSKTHKMYQMHKCLLTRGQINAAVSKFSNLPTEITQWAQSSLI